MITYNLGDIVLIGFTHTDLQGVSKRPAIVLYDSGDQDVLVARITTQEYRRVRVSCAAHLDILELIEKVFKPLHIPADLIPALIAMRDRVTYHQPSRIQDFQQIIDLADRGSLVAVKPDLPSNYENTQLTEEIGEDWVGLFEKARSEGGYLVDFLPLRKKDLTGPPSALPKDADNYLVNCRAVVEALWREGPLSAEEYAFALNALGDEGKKDPSRTVPCKGSLLLCCGNIPVIRVSCLHY
jgi:hypothetical protein